jgi:hypothetical protein
VKTLALVLVLAATSLAAQDGTMVAADAETIEVALMADLNGDGVDDHAAVIRRGEDQRMLRVVTTSSAGHNPAQVLILDPGPLVPATLKIADNVLLLQELTGGTTAVATTHRFRWDEKLGAMRLIGLDAMLYSRTFAHDARDVSWNLLTGVLITRNQRLNRGDGDLAYDKTTTRTSRKRSPPIKLQDAPSGDDFFWPNQR